LAIPIAEARKRARILVIDDEPDAFPVKLLESEGYNITYWESVESIRKLEEGEFDILVLDIGGVSSPEVSRWMGWESLST